MGIHEQFYDIETKACKKYGEKHWYLCNVVPFLKHMGIKRTDNFVTNTIPNIVEYAIFV